MIPQSPTTKGFAAHLDRGPCGHIVCAYAERCSIQTPAAPTSTTAPDDNAQETVA